MDAYPNMAGPNTKPVGAFGPNCGIDDLHLIARANELCNKYLLDTISTGATIAFAMECYEHGLIGPEDTDGLELRFGNGEVLLPLIEMIATRTGFGELLAEGSKRAAEKIGGEAHFFAIQVKGQELAMHDPRGKYNVGMGYAISEIGADHLVVAHDPALVKSRISVIQRRPAARNYTGTATSQPKSGKDGTLLHSGKMEQLRKSDWPVLLRARAAFLYPTR